MQAHSTILLGVSGGADSLFLMDAICRLGLAVHIAHFDHQLRPESGSEARAAAQMAEDRQLPFTRGQGDVRAYADRNALTLEAAARELRYRFLFSTAVQIGAQAVMVAHTADDQVETVLMHLLRGSGLAGLAGMPYRMLPNPWSDEIPLLRPLLDTWRAEIEEYLMAEGLQPLQDATNQDPAYFRNRLRLETIPYLESVRPGFRKALHRTAEILNGEQAVLQAWVENLWPEVVETRRENAVALKRDMIASQPVALQRRLLRRAVAVLRPGTPDLDFAAVERSRELILQEKSGKVNLTSGLWLVCEQDLVWVAAWVAELPGLGWPEAPAGAELRLDVPGSLALGGGWRLDARKVDGSDLLEIAAANHDPYQAWLDIAALTLPLSVRRRKPGDRLTPLGMPHGSIKISDLMINKRLPRRARSAWPLVLSAHQVVWAPGLHSSHAFRLTGASRSAVHLQLRHEQADML